MSATPKFQDPSYIDHINQITTVNSIYDGVDSAKAFIYKFGEEDTKDYEARQDMSSLANYVKTTVDTISDIVFRKQIDQEGVSNATVKEWLKTIDLVNDIDSFGRDLLKNHSKDGHTFILTDSMFFNPDDVPTNAAADGIRPFLLNILRKDIPNWECDSMGRYLRATINRTVTEPVGDYGFKYIQQQRVFLRGGIVEIWEDDKKIDTITDLPWDYVPLTKVGNSLIPELYDQAKININHFNRNSELENYTRVGGAPFLAVFGSLKQEGDQPSTLGITDGLSFQDSQNSDIKWVEMSGANYDMIAKHILFHKEEMIRISVEFATERSNATATEVEKDSTSKESKLNSYANEIEDGLNSAIALFQVYWRSSLGENIVIVNKDFSSNILTDKQIELVINLLNSGNMSFERAMNILSKGEVLPMITEKELDDEKSRLRNQGDI